MSHPISRPFHKAWLMLCFVSLVALGHTANAQQLSADQVVQNLVRMNRARADALQAYQGTRKYRIDYRGFPSNRSAEMVVSVKYHSPGTKDFVIQSTTGSTLIIERAFKKMLQAEQEASDAEFQRRCALTEDNYHFTLVGYESAAPALYVLKVEPRTNNKFLYRGRIWVSAKDFAVVRLEAEPAKNPSFWTKKSEIVQVYTKVGDFWLPFSNRSVSAIRLGGRAELSIDYQDYQITGATQLGNATAHASTSKPAGANRNNADSTAQLRQ